MKECLLAETKRVSPLFSDFISEKYLPFVQENKKSWKMDEWYLEHYVLPHLGACRVNEISADVLKNWAGSLEASGLAASTCCRVFKLAKYALNCAVKWKDLESDEFFKDAAFRPVPPRAPALLSQEEVVQLLDILRNFRHRAVADAIHFMLVTGAMKSEVLYARWEDVDEKNATLTTTKTFTGRARLIPLNTEAMKIIRKLPRPEGVPWLFATRKGTRLQSVTREWYQIREKLGRSDLRLQDLRHNFANLLISIGIDQRGLQGILGHYHTGPLRVLQNIPMEHAARA